MKYLTIIILSSVILNFTNMGMYYSIEANVKTPCNSSFPGNLSFFFEQVGGYEDKSMASQIEKILNIDLHIFQEYDYPENEEPSKKYWKKISVFENVVNDFIAKIKANPQYFKKVKFNPVKLGYDISSDPEEQKEILLKQKEYEANELYGYPNDNGYLSSKSILNDLETFKNILECYKKNGATKIKLNYE